MSTDWIKTLEQIAPTIASALGTPVAGMAVSALEQALGVTGSDDVQKTIEDGKLNGDQVAAIQQAELALKAKAQEMKLDFEQLAVADRSSARQMQMATKSVTVPLLAFFITGGFFGLLTMWAYVDIPKDNSAIMLTMTGALGTAWVSVVNFFFGSSSGSQNKDSTIKLLANK